MAKSLGKHFHHRHNSNGTHDSICFRCYMTVATVGNESDLTRYEVEHACDPARLYQINQFAHRAISAIKLGFGNHPPTRDVLR
jgi:hypothetical protein